MSQRRADLLAVLVALVAAPILALLVVGLVVRLTFGHASDDLVTVAGMLLGT